MARLPVPGSDENTWGNVLNDFLSQAHNSDGSIKLASIDGIQGQPISAATPSDTQVLTYNSATGQWEPQTPSAGAVSSVNTQTGAVVLDPDDLDDTSTTNKFTTAADISKLAGVEVGAEVNNISDANASDLTDATDSILHYHASDRDRANHTGTQAISTITSLQSTLDGKQSRYVSAAAAANTRVLMGKLKRGVQDAQVLVIGDSTGNSNTEWVYLVAQNLASLFPAYTVTFRFWNETTETDYDAPITIQTGTGARTLAFYNCSRSGAAPDYAMGTRFAAAVRATNPDIVLINHGHNAGQPPTTADLGAHRYTLMGVAEQVVLEFPHVPITYIAQNPSAIVGRETWQAIRASILESLAAQRGFGVIDVHQAFIDYGNWQVDLMADTTHPNAAGMQIWAGVVNAAFTDAVNTLPARVQPSPFILSGYNYLANPTFSSWAAADPDSWTMTLCASSKDAINRETGADAMKITASGTGTAYAQQQVTTDIARMKGKWMCVAARVYAPATNTATVRLSLLDSVGGGGNASAADLGPSQRDGWFWMWCVRKIEAASTSVFVRISPRTSGSTTGDITVDRVWLGEGTQPFAGGF